MIKIALENQNYVAKLHYDRVCNDSKVRTKGLVAIITKRANDPAVNPLERGFYVQILSDLVYNNGDNLITGNPAYLKRKIDHYEIAFAGTLTAAFKDQLLTHVYFYSNYDKWGAYDLAKDLKVNVCPYCNRQYTFTISGNKTGNTRPQFDHFYDKATYPYLSLSFYNLIPSCSICNSDLKGSNKFCITLNIHPYLEGFSTDLLFSIKPKNIEFVNGKSAAYRIRFKAGQNANRSKIIRAFRNITVFRLSELYNLHKDYVDEIIIKSRIYNKEYIEMLYKQFEGTLFSDINDVRRLVTSNYTEEKDFGKRPLSKLTSDISNELGLFN